MYIGEILKLFMTEAGKGVRGEGGGFEDVN